jgi:hypothetical protein
VLRSAQRFYTAIRYEMAIVTFDKDFNIEGIDKMTPDEIIEK